MSSNEETDLERSKYQVAIAKKYKRVFESKDGKDVLADLSKFAGVHADPFTAGYPDQTAFFLGQHRVIKRIVSLLAMDEIHHLRIVKDYELKVNEINE